MTPVNKKRLAVGLFSVSCLNFSFISTYPIGRASASKERFASELFQSAGLDRFQIASRPPWEQPSDGTSSYVLPPWGLTVNDFVVTRQMPLSSGRREVLLSSPSTGSEQRLFINLPNSGDFQLYEMAFNRVLVSGSDSLFSEPETRAKLQNFNVKFTNNALSEVVLADGTNARFTADAAVIKSPSGETIETFRLQRNAATSESTLVVAQKTNDQTIYSSTKSSSQQDPLSDGLVLAQSRNSCEENTQRSMDGISNSMAPWTSQMSRSSSELVRAVGWTIGHGSETLKNSGNLSDSRLPELTCRPPVQCEEMRVSGGSEIRTDLFDIPQGVNGGEVTLTYEFFTIPDSLEMYFDGTQVLSIGPTSGRNSRKFRLPVNAKQVGITLKGNNDSNTRWWYVVSCSSTCPVINEEIYGQGELIQGSPFTESGGAGTRNENSRARSFPDVALANEEWNEILSILQEYYDSTNPGAWSSYITSRDLPVVGFAHQMLNLANISHQNREENGGWAGSFVRKNLLFAARDIRQNYSFWIDPPPAEGEFCNSLMRTAAPIDCGASRAGEHHFKRHLEPGFYQVISERLRKTLDQSCGEDVKQVLIREISNISREHVQLINNGVIPGFNQVSEMSQTARSEAIKLVPERAQQLRRETFQKVLDDFVKNEIISRDDVSEILNSTESIPNPTPVPVPVPTPNPSTLGPPPRPQNPNPTPIPVPVPTPNPSTSSPSPRPQNPSPTPVPVPAPNLPTSGSSPSP